MDGLDLVSGEKASTEERTYISDPLVDHTGATCNMGREIEEEILVKETDPPPEGHLGLRWSVWNGLAVECEERSAWRGVRCSSSRDVLQRE